MPIDPPPRRPLPVVLLELQIPDEDPLYISDVGYHDFAAGVVALPRLGKAITFERRISTIFWGGGQSGASLGAIEIINEDGALDWLLARDLRNLPLTIYVGDDATALASMTVAASAMVDRPESIGESALRLVIADAGLALRQPVQTNNYASGDQAGRPQPVLFGLCLSIPALLTQYNAVGGPALSFHDGTGFSVSAVYDQGAALTATTQWVTYNSAPHHGIRLNQSMAGRITADAYGPIYASSFLSSYIRSIVPHVLDRVGFTDFSQTALNDLSTELGATYHMGYFADGSVTAAAILDQIADSISGYWYVDRLGQFQIDRLRLPSGSPVLDITEVELKGEVSITLDVAPGLTTTVCSGRNWHVHGPSELAGSIRNGANGALLMKDYRFRVPFDVHPVYAGAIGGAGGTREAAVVPWGRQASAGSSVTRPPSDAGHGTLLVGVTGAASEATYRGTLFEQPRWFYDCSVELSAVDAATLDPGVCMTLTVTDLKTGEARYELDQRLLRVVRVRGVLGDGRVDLTLWGDGPEPPEESK